MEKRILQPQHIIVPGEYELGNESILKIYFRILSRGYGQILPPVIVANSGFISERERTERLERTVENKKAWLRNLGEARLGRAEEIAEEITDVRERYARFNDVATKAPYYLIDGNHRTAAATLTHNSIYALELQSDEDIVKVRKMIESGELFDFKRPEESLKELLLAFEEHLLGGILGGDYHIEDLRTVQKRVDELVSNGDIPRYMINQYLRKH